MSDNYRKTVERLDGATVTTHNLTTAFDPRHVPESLRQIQQVLDVLQAGVITLVTQAFCIPEINEGKAFTPREHEIHMLLHGLNAELSAFNDSLSTFTGVPPADRGAVLARMWDILFPPEVVEQLRQAEV